MLLQKTQYTEGVRGAQTLCDTIHAMQNATRALKATHRETLLYIVRKKHE